MFIGVNALRMDADKMSKIIYENTIEYERVYDGVAVENNDRNDRSSPTPIQKHSY